MGKNKNNKTFIQSKETDKTKKQFSGKKLKQENKSKKAKEDHIKQIPFRLREIMKSKEQMKMGCRKRKKLNQGALMKSKDVGDIPVPHFKRRKQESVKAFVGRMEAETKHVLFLSKNQVDRKPELDPDQQEGPADKGKSEKKKKYSKDRLLKMQQKRLDRQEGKKEREMFIDNVPFGEVTMAPPCLTAKPKKAQDKSQKSSKDLLLNSLLGQSVASTTAKPSMARQRIMEEERERVVEAYRHLQKQKRRLYDERKLKNLH